MKKSLRIAAVAKIIEVILLYPYLALSFSKGASEGAFGDEVSFSLPTSLVVLSNITPIVMIIVGILWARGFLLIGEYLKSRLLIVSSYFMILAAIYFSGLEWIPLGVPFDLVAFFIGVFFFGIVTIFLGIGILQLQDKLGTLALALAVLLIAKGACMVSIGGGALGLILEIPEAILGAMVLFRAADKLDLPP